MEEYRIYRHILCIDLKGFYASVECVLRGLDPFKTPLIVADQTRGNGSVVLAITPFLKAQGIKTRCRLFEMPQVKNLIIAKPRMKTYLDFSFEIIKIYLDFVSKEDLHIYSVDEAFLDMTAYLAYYKKQPEDLAEIILRTIAEKTKIPAACGIGDNMLLSKLALDLYSKKEKNGIATLRYHDVEALLWRIEPLSKIWGIGPRLMHRLNSLNLYTVFDLAHAPLPLLKKHFGVIGEELYYHAHGIDMSVISEGFNTVHPVKSVGLGQTLFEDYHKGTIGQIFLEMADEVAERLRFISKEAQTFSLGIRYSKAYGGGFHTQMKIDFPTRDPYDILMIMTSLFEKHDEGLPIRKVSMRATHLKNYAEVVQLSFFDSVLKKQKREALFKSVDSIKLRYGKTALMRLSSHFDHGTALKRAHFLGGHHG
jgi:DNA polymerase V